MVNMKDFFISSGYSVSFLYFIMTIESVFGLLLLFNLKFYPKILSLFLLFSVMAGAIVTHTRNGDPLSDSAAAIVLGLKIILVSVIYLLNKKYLLKKAVTL